jgi:uncharacterized repeat protein (TIGR01451 family)
MGAAVQLRTAGYRLVASVALALGVVVTTLGSGAAHAVAPAAGSVIGNQATATYTDSSGVSRTATSNLVQTTVAQVYSHTLTASQSRTVAPGGTVYFPHTLTNTGNGPDTYALGAVDGGTNGAVTFTLGTNAFIYADANGDGVPDNATPITSSGAVIAGGTFRFVVAAQWPGAVTSGSETVTVNTTGNAADASNSPAAAGTNTDTATVTGNAVISVVKSLSVASGPSPSTGNITVTLQYTNTGSATATNVVLFDQLPAGFTYQGTPVWSGGGSPDDADDGTDGGGLAYCANQASPTTLPCGQSPSRIAASIASIAPGASGTLSFQVAVPAGQPIGGIPNTARFCFNDGAGQVPAACTTGSGGNIGTTGTPTNTATYTVGQSYSVRLDDSGPGGAAPVSTTDASAANNDTILVNAADQGSVVQFENIVTNTGNGADTFNLSIVSNTFPAGTTFTFYNATNSAPLTDSNGDGNPDTGVIAAGASTRVWVRAQLPPNATGNAANLQVVKRATSVGNSAVGDSTTDVLGSINRRTIDLTNNTAGGPGAGFQATGEAAAVTTNATNPGTSSNFQLVIANAGPGADNFDLIATSNSTGINTASPTITLPAGWTVTFRLGTCAAPGATVTNTGNVAASGNVTVCATVGVPANASAGTTDIYFRAASPSGANYNNTAPSQYAAFDVKRDAVTVNAVFNLSFTPDRVGQIFPAGNTVYAHQLCNNGNTALAAGSVTFTFANNTAGFTSALWVDVNGNGVINVGTDTPITSGSTYGSALAAGACVTLLDNVFAPAGATNGTVNVTTVTATHATAAPGGVSVTDTSTVVSGDLQIVKDQRTINCDGSSPGTYTQGALAAQLPGACVQYRIVATNSGAANLTSLTVSDATPLFTTLETGACPIAASRSDAGAVTAGGTAADEAGGTVTATVVTALPPLVSMTLTFCVQIDN